VTVIHGAPVGRRVHVHDTGGNEVKFGKRSEPQADELPGGLGADSLDDMPLSEALKANGPLMGG
jgi:hypothetical protein